MTVDQAAPSEATPNVKAFANGDRVLLFLRDRMELRILSNSLAGSADQALPSDTLVESGSSPSFSSQAIVVDRLSRKRDASLGAVVYQEESSHRDERPSIDRLTLTVSNVCNLGCSYCYAAKGTYYNKQGLIMNPDTAIAALNQASRVYSRIEHINFFGGEPSVNCDVIELACDYVRYLFNRNQISSMPTFGITTNGYLLGERVLNLLQTYNFSVTLSLDGPREIHDVKRPTKAGHGSHEAVVSTARQLLARGLEIEFECTFSNEHLRHGFSMIDMMDYFYDEFGCRTLHCQVVSASPTSPEFIPLDVCLHLQGDAIEQSLLNLACGAPKTISLATRMLHSLTSKMPIWNYCPAGRKEVTVNADGEVYACFMLMQSRTYSFGSVSGKAGTGADRLAGKPKAGSGAEQIEKLLHAQDKYTNNACRRCWAQPLCHGCLGEDFERTGGAIIRSEIPGVSEFCDYKRGLVERFFRGVDRAYAALDRSS